MSTLLTSIVVSYDIACQWFKNFWTRMLTMDDHLHIRVPQLGIRFMVPKFHLPAHVTSCQAPFSFNYANFVGRTDGEGVERNWAWLNGAAPSTTLMGPGSRSDTLDDFMGYSNWRKTVKLGASFLPSYWLLLMSKELTCVYSFRPHTAPSDMSRHSPDHCPRPCLCHV